MPAITYATITGRITIPGTEVGIRAQVTATPLTTDNVLVHDDRTDWGSVVAETDNDGNLPATFKLPTNGYPAEALWKFVVTPLEKKSTLRPWTLGVFDITASTTIQAMLIAGGIDVTAVDVTFREDIFEARDSASAAATTASASATSAAASAAAAATITGLTGEDDAVAFLVDDEGSDLTASLKAKFGHKGDGVARFIARARNGENLKVGVIGHSTEQGTGATTTPQRYTSLVCADLATRFGITITEENQGVASYTAFRAFVGLKVDAIVTAQPDLVIIGAFDKNDIGSDQFGQYAPGYPVAQSTAAIERMIRILRANVPKADIMLVANNPYSSDQVTLNGYQRAKDEAVRRLAAVYGCEFVDAYQPFIDLGNYDALVPDGTHPGDGGHRLMADAVLEHIPDAERPARGPGATPAKGLYNPEQVDTTVESAAGTAKFGYMAAASPGTRYNGEFIWTNGGTGWTVDGAGSDTNSTAGSYAEFTFYGTELIPWIDTSTTANAVLDITVDSVLVADNQSMTTGKTSGLNFVPVAIGLTPGWHTVRLTIVSGTLAINQAYALAGPHSPASATVGAIQTILTDTGVVALDPAGAYTSIKAGTVTLPAGWTSALCILNGSVAVRTTATTTTERRMQADLLVGGVSVQLPAGSPLSVSNTATAVTLYRTLGLNHSFVMTANTAVECKARVISTDKTNCSSAGIGVQATLIKLA